MQVNPLGVDSTGIAAPRALPLRVGMVPKGRLLYGKGPIVKSR